ncbi:hypothetical protein [Nocardia anaemiae]|uniref:hypothetical protein n=1 Tax=Nocardia anaemiae TaxID=263910 RepID=UPI0007A4628B|nr:hypothetical protein [Nocardia anaemiae]
MNQEPTSESHRPAAQPAGPAKWKLWLLTVIGIYPLLTILVTISAPLLEPLAPPLRLAAIVPIAVAAMVWGVMPFLTRRCAGWLMR